MHIAAVHQAPIHRLILGGARDMQASARPPMPGPRIHYSSGQENTRSLVDDAAPFPDNSLDRVTIGTWFSAHLPRATTSQTSLASDGTGVTVFIDGYLTEIAGSTVDVGSAANIVLKRYHHEGLSFLPGLRGSYTILICDQGANLAHLVNDRRGSRPIFLRDLGDRSIQAGPEIAELIAGEHSPKISPSAMTGFLAFGAFIDDHTLFSTMRALPQATVMTFTQGGHSTRRYWQFRLTSDVPDSNEETLIDECDTLIRRSVDRLLRTSHKPFLFLSGGVDSRVVLGAMLAIGARIPAVMYGTEHGDDMRAAAALAMNFGLEASEYRISESHLEQYFHDASMDADCRGETIDSPTAAQLHRLLGEKYGTFFNGDECFGWHYGPVSDGTRLGDGDALRAIGLRRLKQVARLRDWLRPGVAPMVARELDDTIDTLVRQAHPARGADLMDTLYYGQRLGNMLNAFTAQRLRFMEQARPLIDEDVAEFVARLPVRYRYDKYLLRRVLQVKYPELAAMPFATKDSIPATDTYLRLLQTNAAMRDFVTGNLLKNLDPRLSEVLDVHRLGACMQAMFAGRPLPAIREPQWSRLPGAWRFRGTSNEVHPMRLILRLLQLNVYLRGLAAS